MAEQSLQARICSKYDTYENWSNMNTTGRGGNLVLKKGEIGVCFIPNKADPASPTLLFKIGDGTTIFANLPWASGLSADVYDWAKTETKPTYTAAEVGALPANTVIPTVPTALKNPKALTFTGAVTGSYDGSSEKTVNIPAAITVDDALSDTSTNPVQNKAVKAGLDERLNRFGDSMAGDIDMTDHKIIGLNSIAFTMGGITNGLSLIGARNLLNLYVNGSGNDHTARIGNVASPWYDNDAANKYYVDAKVPNTTTSDNNKFLRVVNGVPTWVALTNVAEEGA